MSRRSRKRDRAGEAEVINPWIAASRAHPGSGGAGGLLGLGPGRPRLPASTAPAGLGLTPAPAGPVAGKRGLPGRYLGAASYVDVPAEFRGTSVQVCGLFPFIVGAGNPIVGVPIGRHTDNGGGVCFDPISWFRDANLISNPSVSILSRPGLGKSALVRRIGIGLAAPGVTPLIMGDLRPDYRQMVEGLGGQVIVLGRGRARLNPLDPGAIGAAWRKLPPGEAADNLLAELLGRQRTLVGGLLQLVRGQPLADYEDAALAAVLELLAARHTEAGGAPPTLTDLIECLQTRPDEVRGVLLDRGADSAYDGLIDPLLRSLHAVVRGPFGELFAGQSSTRIDLDAPAISLDVSAISDTDTSLQAAALLAAWTEGFGAVYAAQALADAGLGPQRLYLGILDELWRVLRAGSGMVDRVDRTTRLNRADAMGTIYVTHTLLDFDAIASEQDRAKARGIISRTGATILGGLTASDVAEVEKVIPLTGPERERIISWSSPPTFNISTGQENPPPGRGRFLIKAGARPGVPVQTVLTPTELALNDTNSRWLRNPGRFGNPDQPANAYPPGSSRR